MEQRPEDLGPAEMELLLPSGDMANRGAGRVISLDNGALLASFLRQAVLRQGLAAAGKSSSEVQIQKRARGRNTYRAYKKADGPLRRSRDSHYRQCFFNPISCFRK